MSSSKSKISVHKKDSTKTPVEKDKGRKVSSSHILEAPGYPRNMDFILNLSENILRFTAQKFHDLITTLIKG